MDDIAAREQNKYERMWDIPAYRRYAPGQSIAAMAFRELEMRPGDTLADFGCGTGRPAAAMQQMGAVVVGIDHAVNCLDPDVNINFLKCNLWDLPPDLKADYGYCTDVMEHIPTEKVDDVLAGIRRVVRNRTFFQIATFVDGMGKHIGETLHLTVQPPEWWRDTLRSHWQSVTISGNRNLVAVVE